MFGDKTFAGAGGVAVTGTSIASGDPLGHWQIAGGFITKTTAGVSMSAAPYSLVLDDAQVVDITKDVDVYDVRTSAESDAVGILSAGTLAGMTVKLRPGVVIAMGIGDGTHFDRANYNPGLTITSRDPDDPGHITDQVLYTTQYLTITGLVLDPLDGIRVVLNGTASWPCTHPVIDGNIILGLTADPNGDWSAGGWPNDASIGTYGDAHNSDVTITNNVLRYGERGVNIYGYGSAVVVTGNLIDAFYSVGIYVGPSILSPAQTDPPVVTVTDNVITRQASLPTDLNNPHGDGIFISADPSYTADYVCEVSRNRIFTGVARGLMTPIAMRGMCQQNGANFTASISTTLGVSTLDVSAFGYGQPISVGQVLQANNAATVVDTRIASLGTGTGAEGTYILDTDNGTVASTAMQAADFSGHYFVATIIGNMINTVPQEGIIVLQAKDCVVLNNSGLGRYLGPGQGGDGAFTTIIGSNQGSLGIFYRSAGTHRIQRNATELLVYGGSPTLTSNVVMSTGLAYDVTYPAAFVGSGSDWLADDLTVLMAAFAMKASGPLDIGGPPNVGAVGSGAVNWATTVPGSNGSNNVS